MIKSALIIGCGYVGSQLKERLQQNGWQVRGAGRSFDNSESYLKLDVKREFVLEANYDVIFYLVSADSYTAEAYGLAYRQGVVHTLKAIGKSRRPRFIFVSSTSVYSEDQGGVVDETSAVGGSAFSQQALLAGEELVRQSGLDSVVVRFSGIYGPGRYHLIDRIKSGHSLLKKSPSISNRIHLEDCIGILHHVALLDRPSSIYIASDREPSPYNNILIWLAQQLKVSIPIMENESTKSKRTSNKRCSSQLLVDSGYHFHFPSFKEGFKEVLQLD